MNRVAKFIAVMVLVITAIQTQAQKARPVYHPCFLMDSADAHLVFIQQNAARVFTDTIDCKQELLNKIAGLYISAKNKKYLDALAVIRQNPSAKVEELYTDLVTRIIENDFAAFVNELYMAKGRYLSLEKELISTLNMIVGYKPLKQKYLPLLKIEIEKAKDKQETGKAYYLEKLKVKIEEDSH